MSATGPTPGWYPDPAGAGSRWWDGRSWTDFHHVSSARPVAQRPLPEGASTGTPWVLIQAVIPLAHALAEVPYLLSFRSLFAAQTALMLREHGSEPSSGDAHTLLALYGGSLGTFAVTTALSLALSAAWVVFALLDARRLERIGIARPFHWAWSFLGFVYPIGRAVVVRRRVGHGLTPIWVLIGATAVSFVLVLGLEGAILLPTFADVASFASAHPSGCGC